ncbi:MAG: O-antigen ligase family protein [Erythrobacter sp.]|nr:O-antigen ligase family protein [Erythrobacter sp.]NCQ22411.1 O-antigen ligase family protein [Sphingomonadales bacterium]
MLALALLGGSSRPDPIQNALLRPVCALLLIPALGNLKHAYLVGFKVPLALLGLTLLWMIIQLVPLPPSLWQALPDRSIIAQIDRLSDFVRIWRPISLTPFRGLDTLFGLIIPFAALLLALTLKIPARTLLFAIVAIGLADAALGVLQVIGGTGSVFYLYAITSLGAPAGIFANENHSAVFSAIVLLIITRLALESRGHADPAWVRLAFAPAFLFILLAVLITGSRAGSTATFFALVAALLMTWLHSKVVDTQLVKDLRQSRSRARRNAVFAAFAAAIVAVALAFVWLQRVPAFEEMVSRNSFDDLRWQLWPVLKVMASQHWMVGTGFGSFDAVYRIYEPTALLLPRYVNHAHNDWAQLLIEGGLPAAILLTAFLIWIGTLLWRLKEQPAPPVGRIPFWISCIAIIAAASIVDYPLRTPIFQTLIMWLLVCLVSDARGKSEAKRLI